MEISNNEIAPGTVVVTLAGKVRMGTESEQILSLVEDLLGQGKRTIIFNVVGVAGIDSTGIGVFARGTVTEELFRVIEARLGTRGAVDYSGCVCWLQLTMRMMQALGATRRPITDADMEERIESFVAGTADVPDPKARIG